MREGSKEWRCHVGQGSTSAGGKGPMIHKFWFICSWSNIWLLQLWPKRRLRAAFSSPWCTVSFLLLPMFVCILPGKSPGSQKLQLQRERSIDRTKWDGKFIVDVIDFICRVQNGSAHHPQPLHKELLKSCGEKLQPGIFRWNIESQWKPHVPTGGLISTAYFRAGGKRSWSTPSTLFPINNSYSVFIVGTSLAVPLESYFSGVAPRDRHGFSGKAGFSGVTGFKGTAGFHKGVWP